MTELHTAIVGRRAQAALRFLAISGLAATLAGCLQSAGQQSNYPTDYRLRHPITVKETSPKARSRMLTRL